MAKIVRTKQDELNRPLQDTEIDQLLESQLKELLGDLTAEQITLYQTALEPLNAAWHMESSHEERVTLKRDSATSDGSFEALITEKLHMYVAATILRYRLLPKKQATPPTNDTNNNGPAPTTRKAALLKKALNELRDTKDPVPFEMFIFDLYEELKAKIPGPVADADNITILLNKKLNAHLEIILASNPDFDLISAKAALNCFDINNYTHNNPDYLSANQAFETYKTELKAEGYLTLIHGASYFKPARKDPSPEEKEEYDAKKEKYSTLRDAPGDIGTRLQSVVTAVNLLQGLLIPAAIRKHQPIIAKLIAECDSCLADLADEIFQKENYVSTSWSSVQSKEGLIKMQSTTLLGDGSLYHENGRLNEEAVFKECPEIKALVHLCKQHNDVNEIRRVLISPEYKSYSERMSAFQTKVKAVKNNSNIKPGSRFREFFRNISRTLSRIYKRDKKINLPSLFSRASRAEQTVERVSSLLKKNQSIPSH